MFVLIWCLLALSPVELPSSAKQAIAIVQTAPPAGSRNKNRTHWQTMANAAKLAHVYNAIRQNVSGLDAKGYVDGAIVELGVWRGGSSMVMMWAELAARTAWQQNAQEAPWRDFWLYDTFEGMPAPGKYEEKRAHRRWAGAGEYTRNKNWSTAVRRIGGDGNAYVDQAGIKRWNYSPLEVVQRNVETTGYPKERVHYIKGTVETTLIEQLRSKALPSRIAVLRLDTDWYESTKAEFEVLAPRLAVGGLLIVDDYCSWAGARKATDEFLLNHRPEFFVEHDGSGLKASRLAECFAMWRVRAPRT